MMMVKKPVLPLLAGFLWLFAGCMIVYNGWPGFRRSLTTLTPLPVRLAVAIGALVIFLLFYWFIFAKLVRRHTDRVRGHAQHRMPIYHFFDRKSYIIMAVMMIGGALLRMSGVLPFFILGPLYMGIGCALFSGGTRFVSQAIRMYRS